MSYIEREAVLAYPIRKDHCDKKNANEHFIFGIESVMEYVEDLPAADVVPVIRCRECKNLCVGGVWFGDACWGCKILEVSVDLDFFCGFGERKEDDHD